MVSLKVISQLISALSFKKENLKFFKRDNSVFRRLPRCRKVGSRVSNYVCPIRNNCSKCYRVELFRARATD